MSGETRSERLDRITKDAKGLRDLRTRMAKLVVAPGPTDRDIWCLLWRLIG